MDEFKDRRLKYVEMPQVFQRKAGEIGITSKQHLRACERLADHLSKQKPKTPQDFERVEWMKDFVVKSSELNERTIDLLDYLRDMLQEVANDALSLAEGAKIRDVVRDQSDAIEMLTATRDRLINELYGKQRIGADKTAA